MIVILIGYAAIVLQWFTLWYVERQNPEDWPKAKRALWWLLAASAIVALAWFSQRVWVSFIGMLLALTSVSFVFQTLTNWLKKKKLTNASRLVWFEWMLVLSVTIAHVFVLVVNYLHEATH